MLKSEQLLQIAKKTLERGDKETAKEITVLALSTADAMDALDRLLPQVQAPEFSEEELNLTEGQVAKLQTLAKEIEEKEHQDIATSILARLEKIEKSRKRS